jgi:glutamate synthase domain-containing protein 1
MSLRIQPPQADGLYDPRFEHDACGVAMVARLDNRPTHEVVDRALVALDNLEHRGAEGADIRTGDGAGILVQMPDAFLRAAVGFELPPLGDYGVAQCFLPTDPARREKIEQLLEMNVRVEGQRVLGWRDVPLDEQHVGDTAAASRPNMRQLFIAAGPGFEGHQMAFERKLYVIRRIVELAAGPDFYASSCSSRTLVYKGMLISHQLRHFYPDLADERFASALALVHSRFSTNTFPSWERAHPYRVICHNGEINTLMGNVNWMRARESQLASELFGIDLQKVMPVVRPGGSDSATFDNVLELLMLAGRSLPHAAMMMIPEAYRDRDDLPEELKGF